MAPITTRRTIHRWQGFLPLLLAALWILGGAGAGGAANLPPVQTFFIPLPEQQTRTSLASIDSRNRTGTVIDSVISIVATGDGTVIYFDQWEDGYELDIANPSQATTQIWGDGNSSNGDASSASICGPACAGDIINGGDVIALRNDVNLPHCSGRRGGGSLCRQVWNPLRNGCGRESRFQPDV
jgi:hypothetical protein